MKSKYLTGYYMSMREQDLYDEFKDMVIFYNMDDRQFFTKSGHVIINIYDFLKPSQIQHFLNGGFGPAFKYITRGHKIIEVVYL